MFQTLEMTLEDFPLYQLEKVVGGREWYCKNFQDLTSDFSDELTAPFFGKPLSIIYSELEEWVRKEEEEHISQYLFPSHYIHFYPQLIERRTKKPITCDYSGAPIYSGSRYLFYHAFLHDITSGKRYVMKRGLHIEIGSDDFLPFTLSQFEELDQRIIYAYENEDDEAYDIGTRIGGSLLLRELGQKRYVKKMVRRK